MKGLFVDDRYRGVHGIGRYAGEVLPRLGPPWRPLGLTGSPHSPLDWARADRVLRDADVVYSPGYGALIRARQQILTIHDLIQLRVPWPGRARFVAYYAGPVRAAVRRAGVVLTVSETSARDIRRWVDDDTVQVINAGNGCSAAFRADVAVSTDTEPGYVAYVGNLRAHKNFDVVLRALVHARGVMLRAVIPPSEVPLGQARADALGVGERVQWLHGLDDERLADLYRRATATVLPSVDEGFGLPALESVACGTPVIFWRGCATVAEIVGDRGWAMESARDVRAWAAVLEEASGTPRRVASRADDHGWDRTAATVSDVLERALGR